MRPDLAYALVYADSDGLRLTRKYERWQTFLASGRVYRTEVRT